MLIGEGRLTCYEIKVENKIFLGLFDFNHTLVRGLDYFLYFYTTKDDQIRSF